MGDSDIFSGDAMLCQGCRDSKPGRQAHEVEEKHHVTSKAGSKAMP